MSDKPFEFIQSMTRQHRADHGCGAYTFEDGPGLTALAATHRASRVLELGTALGYTGCCLAAAASNTHVDSIEMDTEHVPWRAKTSLERGYPIAYGFIRAPLGR
jgi:predicted O-methyltransferase YrrM